MLDNRVVTGTHARHFVGPGCARLLSTYGATVICHDEAFFDDESRTAFESEFPEHSRLPLKSRRMLSPQRSTLKGESMR